MANGSLLNHCIFFGRSGYLDDSGDYQPTVSQMATMTVTSLQLAIISQQLSSVIMLLSLLPILEGKDEDEARLQFIGEPKTSLEFEEGIWRYFEGDRMLHGCCAFFLAARFHHRSLEYFVECFRHKTSVLKVLIGGTRTEKCPEHPMRLTAFHMAACNPEADSRALRYDLACTRIYLEHLGMIFLLQDTS